MVRPSLKHLALCSAVLAAACSAPLDEELSDQEHGHDMASGEEELSPNLLTGSGLPSKTIAWTVDDGPNPAGTGANTMAIAEYLASEGVPATFFFVGARLTGTRNMADWRSKRFPRVSATLNATIRSIQALPVAGGAPGHLIANHTFSHQASITTLTASERVAEFINTHNLLKPYLTEDIRLMRTPYGAWNASTFDALQQTNTGKSYVGNVFWNAGGTLNCSYNTDAGWSCAAPETANTVVDAADWSCWAPGNGRPAVPVEECAKGYVNSIEGRGKRGIVLMHDANVKSVALVKLIIPELKARGYRFVRVDQVPIIAAKLAEVRAASTASEQPTHSYPLVVQREDTVRLRSQP